MKRKPIQVDVSHLEAMRDAALAEARSYQETLDVIYRVAKLAKKTERITGRVQARAASEGELPAARRGRPSATRDFVDAHADFEQSPFVNARRLLRHPDAQRFGLTAKAIESAVRREQMRRSVQRKKTLKEKGDSAMDRVRKLFASTNGTPLTREEVGQQAKLAEVINNPKFVNQSAAKVLEALVRRKEVKAVRGGFIAGKLHAAE